MVPFPPPPDQSRRASFASVRQSSMETPPNATPQSFRQPVSAQKHTRWTKTHFYALFYCVTLDLSLFIDHRWVYNSIQKYWLIHDICGWPR